MKTIVTLPIATILLLGLLLPSALAAAECWLSASPSLVNVGGSTTVTVSYSDFTSVPTLAAGILECGSGSTASPSVTVDCTGSPIGTCAFTCSPYNTAGASYSDVSAKINKSVPPFPPVDCGTTTVNVKSLSSEVSLKITRFDADTGPPGKPLSFPPSDPAAPNKFSSIEVNVRNLSDSGQSISVTLEVLNPLTNEAVLDAASSPIAQTVSCGSVGAGAECALDETRFPALNNAIGSLGHGSYKLRASVFGSLGNPQDQKALYFTVGKPVPVPELGLLLLPLVAFSVLAVLFFAGRRKT